MAAAIVSGTFPQVDPIAQAIEFADAVGARLMVLADSGIRSGLDVVRMLSSGAKGVLLGRAWVYALAAAGEAGLRQLLEIMAREMRVAMTLTGAARVSELGRSNFAPPRP